MKLFANVAIFETQQEINHMSLHKNFKIGKVRIYPRKLKEFRFLLVESIEYFMILFEKVISVAIALYDCAVSFISFLFCWLPFIGIDCVKEEK